VTAKRPTLAKKQTRQTKAKVDSALDMGAQFTIDGEVYKITTGDLSALDVMALRKQTGKSFPQLLSELFGDDSDIDTIAAVLWLARKVNGDEPHLTFEQVAEETGYDVITKIREGTEQVSDDDETVEDLGTLDPEE
jgi:hypothetical protein